VGKYDPLKAFLQSQSTARVPMQFAEIEDLLGFKLPGSKQYPAWWSNNPSNNTMTKAWLSAGFMTENVDIASERLVFRRARERLDHAPPTRSPASAGGYPGFGGLKGTVRVAEGFDLTSPADPEWGELNN